MVALGNWDVAFGLRQGLVSKLLKAALVVGCDCDLFHDLFNGWLTDLYSCKDPYQGGLHIGTSASYLQLVHKPESEPQANIDSTSLLTNPSVEIQPPVHLGDLGSQTSGSAAVFFAVSDRSTSPSRRVLR